MKALQGKIIVKAYLEQKESHEVKCDDGRVVQLYIGRKYAENNREANPTVCTVVNVGENVGSMENGSVVEECCSKVEEGWTLIVNHNLIQNKAAWIENRDGYVLLTISADSSVYARIHENGTLEPLFGNIIAKRRECKDEGKIVAFCGVTENYLFDVLAVSKDEEDISVGDTILCYKYSDYEMVYNYGGRECRAIRIKKADVLGKVNKEVHNG